MSDLISRSDVIKVLEECHLDEKLFEKDVFDKVKAIPTAYDIEKVVAELESLSNAEADYYYATSNDVIDRENAIDIVKRGGVE